MQTEARDGSNDIVHFISVYTCQNDLSRKVPTATLSLNMLGFM